MRNIIQLIGGVAVAGAVAAGSTAFTANGVTAALVGGNIDGTGQIIAGGALAAPKSVVGARLTEAVFTHDGTDPNLITGVNIKIDGGSGVTLPVTSSVKVKIASGGGTSTNKNSLFYACTSAGGTAWTCLDPTGNYTGVTTLDVAVVPTVA
ncbi:hypothetical protein [Actinoplanes utahensis]|uniref:Uncharacterized protein n=1 Tax=Actinoplanes utahensis TaxID=1869 RepID=A0A0A6UE26_ACTUT|nr:hypothetical protein [Actinoplanes utahensis]KHD73741.1 hypothetical protein MB27_32300 [Actinoplanes utahensis]GIF27903.1 hypothetical protein Aut01nite_08890 [Actinoplanes utahensis]